MQPSGDKDEWQTAELQYRAPHDELSVVYAPVGDLEFDEYVEDVLVSFARGQGGQDAQVLAIYVRALTFARSAEWRGQVRRLLGPTVWRRASALAHDDRSTEEEIAIPKVEWEKLRSEAWPSVRAAILR